MKKLILIIFAFFLTGCSHLIFFPEKKDYPNPNLKKYKFKDVYFETSDKVRLHGWFFKTENPEGTVVFFHGNAENITTHVNSIFWFVDNRFDVFIFDYRGYGKSEGRPSLKGVHIDGLSAVKFCVDNLDKTGKIILFGQSLGGEIAIYVAANYRQKNLIKLLIVDSTFSSYRKLAREKLSSSPITWIFQPLAFFLNDKYSPVRWIDKVFPIPIIFIHGKKDRVIPFKHSLVLFKKYKGKKHIFIVENAGHIQGLLDKEVRSKVLNLIRLYISK